MNERAKSLLFRFAIFNAAFVATTLFMTYPPKMVGAVGLEADAMCLPIWNYACPCGVPCPPKSGKIGGQGCPCSDVTSGFKTTGICVAPLKCLAKSAQNQQGGEGMPKMPELPKGGGGGGEGGQQNDPCLYGIYGQGAGVPGSTNGTSTATSTNPCPQNSGAYVGPSSYSDIASSVFSPIDTSGFANALFGSITQPASNPFSGTSATSTASSSASQPKNESGTFGDIFVKDKTVVTLASTRDTKKNIQVSGFMTVQTKSAAEATLLAERICLGRIWLTNFLSSIVPASILDRVCVTKSIVSKTAAPTEGSTAPATTKSTTKKTPSIYEAGSISLPSLPGVPAQPKDISPQVALWAVPERVFKNSKTTVYWRAVNVDSCTVRSSDGAEFGTGLTGNRATPVLTRATVYTFECKVGGQKMVTTVGIVVE